MASEKVTLETLDGRLDKSDARLDRVEADIATLKTDVGTLKTQSLENTVAIRRLEEDLSDFRTEVLDSLDDIKLQQKTMTAAVMEAVTQLHLSRTYEKRLVRLEEAVFGKAD
ncbi:MAG: hypothetical protein Q8N23_30295 [Archangium sp.]|nr:hypothetical protein [Archangium sp.]MDP3157001.1 hypothetical protein [Archangium sp.]MDP3575718.1 hypothetical protein [Archangium sp.]